MKIFTAFISGLLASTVTLAAASQPPAKGIPANPQLVKFHERFATPKLEKLSERVYGAFAYEYSNFTFIEGDDGVIVVDTGWYEGGMTQALAAFRKISQKPIVALLYTHSHLDHTGASGVVKAEAAKGIQVYAPADWQHYLQYSLSPLRPMVIRRALGQMGIVLPKGPFGTVGAGIGPNPGQPTKTSLMTPDVAVAERTTLNIAGVKLELIPTPGDIPANMMVWLPDEAVLISGDLLGGTFPYVESARYEPDRDPMAMVASLDIARGLKPKAVVPGHGRLLIGAADVAENLTLNRDLIQYLSDQMDRMVIAGMNADQVVENFHLPAVYAEHPDLQAYYHRIEWMLRGMFLKRAGWNGDIIDLVGLGERRESSRLIELLGGTDAVLGEVKKALAKGDVRWAAGLADKILQVDSENTQAQQLLMAALGHIAAHTNSANERNYVLTELAERSGKLNWEPIIQRIRGEDQKSMPSDQLLQEMRSRVAPQKAEAVSTKPISVRLSIDNEANSYRLTVRNSVLIIEPENSNGKTEVSLSRDTLKQLHSGALAWSEALSTGLIHCAANCTVANAVFSIIES